MSPISTKLGRCVQQKKNMICKWRSTFNCQTDQLFEQTIISFEFYGCSTLHKSWDRWGKKTKRKRKLRNAPQTTSRRWTEHKRSFPESLPFTRKNEARFASAWEKSQNGLRTTFLNVLLQGIQEFLYWRSIVSSIKGSANLEKWLHASGEAENQHWTAPWPLTPSDGTASKSHITVMSYIIKIFFFF